MKRPDRIVFKILSSSHHPQVYKEELPNIKICSKVELVASEGARGCV